MNMVYSFTSVWGLNYEFMEEDKPRRADFILLLLGTVAFLVGTTSGLHLIFKAANRWVPGLEIGQVTGGWRDLSLKIFVMTNGVAVNAGEVHLAVGLNCLWDSSLCVNDLSLKNINVAIDSKRCRHQRRLKRKRAVRLTFPHLTQSRFRAWR